MLSSNTKYEIARINTMVMLLHKKALLRGINDNTFCHNIAYNPKQNNTPMRYAIYSLLKVSYNDALLLRILEKE